MEIISDPDMEVYEKPTTFAELDTGDVYRPAGITFEEALFRKQFFVKGTTSGKDYAFNMSDGTFDYVESIGMEVIVHVAKLVVLPN